MKERDQKKRKDKEVKKKLKQAEDMIDAIREDEVDAVIGKRQVSYLRSRSQIEEQEKREQALEREIIDRSEKLRKLTIRLSQAEQQERMRIAELLHDHLQQLLVQIKFKMKELKEENLSVRQSTSLEIMTDLLNESIEATRSLSSELHPPVLKIKGFESSIEWLCEHMENYGMEVEFYTEGDLSVSDEELRNFLFQALREFLFNVQKHAGVPKATVTAKRTDGGLEIQVGDEGNGFDPNKISLDDTGYGLFHIQERIWYYEGTFSLESRPGDGTRVKLFIPLTD